MSALFPRSWLRSLLPASRASGSRTRRTAARLHLEPLEDRQLLSREVFIVTNTNDSGAGSLRQAIVNANSHPNIDPEIGNPDLIYFSVGEVPRDFFLMSPLPAISDPVYIFGDTANDTRRAPLYTIWGAFAGPSAVGLALPSDGSIVTGLTFRSFDSHGIVVTGDDNVIDGCYIGTDPFETFGAGNGGAGVFIAGDRNTVRGCVVSGNAASGVVISGPGAEWNKVGGAALSVLGSNRTYVGTNWDGTIAVPNGQFGVWIENGARSNLVGYSSRPDVISGNNWGGVAIVGSGTRNNGIRNTYIGTNAAGTAPLGNGTGVFVGQGATLNGIGGSAASQRNVISGNRDYGIILTDFGTRLNHVRGNLIGTNRDGLAAIPNQKDGVWIGNGASENHIGFTFPGTGNIISGNYWSGVALFHRGTIGNTIQGNYIGTTVAGDAPLGNGGAGVWIAQEASSNVIGGSTTGARNVIAAHYYAPGVMIRDVSTHSNVVKGNYIGTNAAGNAALGNNQGVQVALGASFNTIKGNLISGNLGEGVALIDARTVRNAVLGNVIGLTAAGTALGNYDGVSVTQGANGNYIGGAEVGAGNVIARNMRHGVVLQGYGTSYNYVQGNFIRHNADSGILIASAASANIIGGSLPGEANTITGNRRNGIRTVAVGRRNLIRGNSIYANGALGIDINSNGVTLAHTVKLTEAVTSNTGTTITGQVIGAPNATYTVELFASADADPSGFGEGERPLPGLYTVTTDGNGNGYFRVTLRSSLTVGYFVSSTATEADGTTWEFGNSLRVRGV